jgi:UPF0716 protein FxsA
MRPPLRARVVFLALLIAEIAVIVLAARWLGGWVVFWLMVATSLLGGWVVRNEGVRAWTALSEAVRAGRAPERGKRASRAAIAGGFLLILPGFITDLVGAALVLPPTRDRTTRLLSRLTPAPAFRPGPYAGPPSRGEVIEGEIVDDGEPKQ